MSIAWRYLDKREGTEKALKDYPDMLHIVQTASTITDEAKDQLYSPRSSTPRLTPGAHDPKAGENFIVNRINTIDLYNERYELATEFIAWFQPAWLQLDSLERYILEEYYMVHGNDSVAATIRVCEQLGIERATAYRKKAAALERLSLLLFGL